MRTGEWQGGEVEVTSGLEPGQRIVVAGLQKIQDGQTVEPVDPGPARRAGGGGGS